MKEINKKEKIILEEEDQDEKKLTNSENRRTEVRKQKKGQGEFFSSCPIL
jgi:hypothetical protein